MGSVFEAMTAFATLLGLGSTVTDVRDNVLIISMFFFLIWTFSEQTGCNEFFCLNGGTCVVHRDNVRCSCLSDYNGTNCAIGTESICVH